MHCVCLYTALYNFQQPLRKKLLAQFIFGDSKPWKWNKCLILGEKFKVFLFTAELYYTLYMFPGTDWKEQLSKSILSISRVIQGKSAALR